MIVFVLKSAIIIANQGVRQGASTGSVLFILYMDKMVQMINSINEADGFLAKLHTLVLMDDTGNYGRFEGYAQQENGEGIRVLQGIWCGHYCNENIIFRCQ